MIKLIHAPFTTEEAQNINRFNNSGAMHPFTCAREHLTQGLSLVAVAGQGWVCPSARCDYTQDWAYGFMALSELA